MEDRKLYEIIAGKVQHLSTLNDKLSNATGRDDELARLEEIADRVEQDLSNLRDLLPSGSGIDNGTRIDIRKCWVKSDEVVKLTLNTSYHHMNDTGYYDGWTDHVVTIRPTLTSSGFSLAITGRNRNDIKDYLGEVFEGALNEPVRETIEIQEGDKRTVSYHLARFLDPPTTHCRKCGGKFRNWDGDNWATFECGTFHNKCVDATLEHHVLPSTYCPSCGEDVEFPNTDSVCGECAKKPLTHGHDVGGSVYCNRCYDVDSFGERAFPSKVINTGECENCKVQIPTHCPECPNQDSNAEAIRRGFNIWNGKEWAKRDRDAMRCPRCDEPIDCHANDCPRAKSEPCPGCGEGGTGDPTDHAIGCQFFNDN